MSSLWDRVSAGVCRRAFSSPEAFAYELCIAPAVRDAVAPHVVPLVPAGRTLDVGAGSGLLAAEMCGADGAVVAVDPSASEVRRLARRAQRAQMLLPVRAVAGALPFDDGAFDAVVSCCAIKHWPDPMVGLDECLRVARLDARLVLIEIDGEATEEEFARFAATSRVPVGMKRAYTRFAMRTVVGVAPGRHDLERLLAGAGTKVCSVDRIEGTPFLLAHAMVV